MSGYLLSPARCSCRSLSAKLQSDYYYHLHLSSEAPCIASPPKAIHRNYFSSSCRITLFLRYTISSSQIPPTHLVYLIRFSLLKRPLSTTQHHHTQDAVLRRSPRRRLPGCRPARLAPLVRRTFALFHSPCGRTICADPTPPRRPSASSSSPRPPVTSPAAPRSTTAASATTRSSSPRLPAASSPSATTPARRPPSSSPPPSARASAPTSPPRSSAPPPAAPTRAPPPPPPRPPAPAPPPSRPARPRAPRPPLPIPAPPPAAVPRAAEAAPPPTRPASPTPLPPTPPASSVPPLPLLLSCKRPESCCGGYEERPRRSDMNIEMGRITQSYDQSFNACFWLLVLSGTVSTTLLA